MHIRVLAVGTRQPRWVDAAVGDYLQRLPQSWRFSLEEIPAAHRGNQAPAAAVSREGAAILAELGESERLIALDERGKQVSSEGLADWIEQWQADGRDVCLCIGGADGLSSECLDRAERRWSLSDLTLPHGLARVLLVEQLYRAWTLQTGHPYHRA